MRRVLIAVVMVLLLAGTVSGGYPEPVPYEYAPPEPTPEGAPADCTILDIAMYPMPPFGDLYQILCWSDVPAGD